MASRFISSLPSTSQPGRFYKLASADGVVSLAMDTISAPAIDESRMCATAIISTPTPDRVRDVMLPRGIDLTDYRLNPVVLWEHGLAGITTPIAKSEHADGRLAIDVFDDRVEGTAYHTSKNQESANIFGLLAERIVRASSIRAADNSKSKLSRDAHGKPVVVVEWWPLIEWSWGMVGVNPETVTKVLDRGRINGDKLAPSIRKSLLPYAARVRSDTRKPPLPLKKSLRGKTMDPNQDENEQIKARLAELTPEELQAELASAQESGDEELAGMIQEALGGAGGGDAGGKTEGAETEAEDSLDGAPPSARFLSMLHGKIAALVAEAESLSHTYENPDVQELAKNTIAQLKTGMGEMATAFSGITGGKALGCEGGKCDDEKEMELMKTWIIEGGLRPLQARGHAARLKTIAGQKTLSLDDQATLSAFSAIFSQAVGEQRRKSLAAEEERRKSQAVTPPVVSLEEDLKAASEIRKSLSELGVSK